MSEEKRKVKEKWEKEWEGKQIVMLEIDKIGIPEERITSGLHKDKLEFLIESVKEKGILQPILVREVGGRYILVDGLHRLYAARELGKKKVPAIIKRGKMKDVLIDNLIANMIRGESDPIQEAKVLHTLQVEEGLSPAEIAKKTGLSVDLVKKRLALLELPPLVQQFVAEGKLSIGSALELLKLPDEQLQIEVATDAVNWGYTVEQTRNRVEELLNPEREPEPGQYTFDETGRPQVVYPTCDLCGRELPGYSKSLMLCPECYNLIMEAIEEMKRLEEQAKSQTATTELKPQEATTTEEPGTTFIPLYGVYWMPTWQPTGKEKESTE